MEEALASAEAAEARDRRIAVAAQLQQLAALRRPSPAQASPTSNDTRFRMNYNLIQAALAESLKKELQSLDEGEPGKETAGDVLAGKERLEIALGDATPFELAKRDHQPDPAQKGDSDVEILGDAEPSTSSKSRPRKRQRYRLSSEDDADFHPSQGGEEDEDEDGEGESGTENNDAAKPSPSKRTRIGSPRPTFHAGKGVGLGGRVVGVGKDARGEKETGKRVRDDGCDRAFEKRIKSGPLFRAPRFPFPMRIRWTGPGSGGSWSKRQRASPREPERSRRRRRRRCPAACASRPPSGESSSSSPSS